MIFDFFRKKDKQDKSFLIQDSIRGCMMAGAAGDALGYPVEFWSKTVINFHHGAQGITQFKLAPEGKALVSDDTQMTLFTANGLLMGMTRKADLTKITADQAAFAAQKDSPEGKKTLNAYYWMVCGAQWDASNQ